MVLLLNELIKYYHETDTKSGKDIWIDLKLLASMFHILPLMIIEAIPLMTREDSARDKAMQILGQHLDKL